MPNNNNNKQSLSVKAKFTTETRRFLLEDATFARLHETLTGMFNAAPLTLRYLDADGDCITFSTEREFADLLTQLTPSSGASPSLTVMVEKTAVDAGPLQAAPVSSPSNPEQAAAPAPPTPAQVWLSVPVWRRHQIKHCFNLTGDVADAATFEELPANQRALLTMVHAHKFAKLAKQSSTGAPSYQEHAAPVADQSSDEAMWNNAPTWFRMRVTRKHAPSQVAQPSAFSTFASLPVGVQARVRHRCMQLASQPQQPHPPHPPIDEASDRAMWHAAPAWVRLRIASHSRVVLEDPHSFAVFQALPGWKQEKIRAKAAKANRHPHPRC